MKSFVSVIAFLLLFLFMTSCVTTIKAKKDQNVYIVENIDDCKLQDEKTFHYVFGFHVAGELSEIVKDNNKIKLETENDFVDILTLLTLGIYRTHSVNVYNCEVK